LCKKIPKYDLRWFECKYLFSKWFTSAQHFVTPCVGREGCACVVSNQKSIYARNFRRLRKIYADDVAYLKVDDSNKQDFVEANSSPFNPYPDKVKTTVMSYYEIPVDVLEDRDQLAVWAERSFAIARKKK